MAHERARDAMRLFSTAPDILHLREAPRRLMR